ncbi:MAG TPA: transcriptional regulator NrdR [Chloroflexia bacterium]|nr:transcriptional regulator NrdR [Chloroflexia bacterium]
MKCPYCHYEDTQVTDSRMADDGSAIKRRRQCKNCHRRFTTYERIERIGLTVVKKDGKREEYSREKLFKSISIACTKRPISVDELEATVNEIEAELFRMGASEVPTEAIGELIIQKLRALDEVAYIRFASVYRNFADLDEMREAMEGVVGIHAADEPQDSKRKGKKANGA